MKSISNKKTGNQNKTLSSIRQELNVSGKRITNQRTLILEIIRQGEGHLDADEIYRQAKEKQPRISLSTVYRTLQTLTKLGIITELHFDESHKHYEVKAPTQHQHLICIECGKVIEFECPLSQKLKETLSDENGFLIIDEEVRMRGYCPDCRQNI
ncbi:Fur family transcriptional regulator [Chloroflexota bacterium]